MKRLTAVMAGNLLVLAGVPVAHAQDADTGLQLEEVIVTAEKRETDLQKTAMSIQVYSGEDLKKQGKKRIDEIMNGVIGVQSQDSQVGKTFFIRGVDGGYTPGGPANGSGTTVAVLIDGVYQARGETVRGGTLDVSQVEVMRGTQSSNLGVNALAGAVSLVTNKPVFEYQASGSLEMGNYHLLNTEGVLNVPLSDAHALRFAYSSNKRDGYLSSGAGESDISNARLKYRWSVNNDIDLVATASHQNIGGNGVSQGVLTYSGVWVPYVAANASSYQTIMGYPPIFGLVNNGVTFRDRDNPWDDGYPLDVWPNNPFRDTNIDDYSVELNWNLGFGTLTVLPSVEHAHFRSQEPPRGSGTGYMGEDRRQNTQQLDVRLASASGSKLEWLAGAYYYFTDFSGTFKTVGYPNDGMCNGGTGSETCYSWTRDKESSTLTQSVYGNVRYSLLDKLRLLAGLRYSSDKKVAQGSIGQTVGTAAGPSSSFSYNDYDASWSDVVYSAGVEYDVQPNSMLYATYKTGYQPGSINGMTGIPTEENTSDQITLGYKSRFLDNKLQFNAEAFSMNFKNRPVGNSTGTIFSVGDTTATSCSATNDDDTPPFVANDYSCLQPQTQFVVDQRSQGLDLEFSFVPTSADRLDLTLEYLKAEYRSQPVGPSYSVADVNAAAAADAAAATAAGTPTTFVQNDAAAQALIDEYNDLLNAYKGLPLQNAPKYSGNLTYSHRFDLPNGSSLTPSINAFYKDAYWSQGGAPGPLPGDLRDRFSKGAITRQDAYTLWNFYTTWQNTDGKFSVNGYVKNLANKPIQTNIGGEPGSSVLYVSLDAPRTYGVSFNANF